ncbi:MAG: fatty acid desaturase, partial [Candidatus Puniceispirillaceae bacterium]
MFAGVPCYHLKALHKATADDMPAPRTLLGAWTEMRETWKRQKVDPDYAYDTPVPSEGSPARSRDAMAASIGEL